MSTIDELTGIALALSMAHDRFETIRTVLWRREHDTGRFQAEYFYGAPHAENGEDCIEELQNALEQSRILNQLAPGFENPRILGPIHGQKPAVLELHFAEHLSDPAIREKLSADFAQLCDELSETDLGTDRVRSAAEFAQMLPSSTLRIHRSLNVRDTADISANELVFLTGCDRAFVATLRGASTKILSMSGQESPRGRAKQVKGLTRLCNEVLKSSERLIYAGDVSECPPAVRKLLLDYIHESRVTMLVIEPLIPPQGIMRAENLERPTPDRAIGALVVEQQTGYTPRPHLLDRVLLLSHHIAVAMSNSGTFTRIPFARGLTAIGRMLMWFRGRKKWLAAAIVTSVIGVGVGLALIPWTYHVATTGQLMPVVRQDVFASEDAIVVNVLVDDGQKVTTGEKLIELRSDSLEQAFVTASNAYDEKTRLLQVLEARLADAERHGITETLAELSAEISRARIEQRGANEEKTVLRNRLDSLTVVAPFDGRVVGFRVQQTLANRPVARGERLLEVIQPKHRRLELQIPEYRMGHVQAALETGNDQLRVNYLLASDVDERRKAVLTQLATRVDESTESGTVVLGFADVDDQSVSEKHIGADVEARIDCGKRSLGYVLFGDLVEFTQRHLWW